MGTLAVWAQRQAGRKLVHCGECSQVLHAEEAAWAPTLRWAYSRTAPEPQVKGGYMAGCTPQHARRAAGVEARIIKGEQAAQAGGPVPTRAQAGFQAALALAMLASAGRRLRAAQGRLLAAWTVLAALGGTPPPSPQGPALDKEGASRVAARITARYPGVTAYPVADAAGRHSVYVQHHHAPAGAWDATFTTEAAAMAAWPCPPRPASPQGPVTCTGCGAQASPEHAVQVADWHAYAGGLWVCDACQEAAWAAGAPEDAWAAAQRAAWRCAGCGTTFTGPRGWAPPQGVPCPECGGALAPAQPPAPQPAPQP